MPEPVIEVRGLRKAYGDREAVSGLDLEVRRGEVFAFLGPNGAGKTTTVEILEGYRTRDAGEVQVLGVDPAVAPRAWRARLGVVLQACRVPSKLTVEEAVRLFAGYYDAARPVDEVLELVGLVEERGQRAGRLSGGQQRRLDVGLALVGDPELLFLDEPTTGFDPSARRSAWALVDGLRKLGKTVFLTTHYLDEAQALADRVAIIRGGRLVAEGPPGELAAGGARGAEVRFSLPAGVGVADLPALGAVVQDGGAVSVRPDDPVRALHVLTGWALEHGHPLPGLGVSRPSLEDVYLELTREQA